MKGNVPQLLHLSSSSSSSGDEVVSEGARCARKRAKSRRKGDVPSLLNLSPRSSSSPSCGSAQSSTCSSSDGGNFASARSSARSSALLVLRAAERALAGDVRGAKDMLGRRREGGNEGRYARGRKGGEGGNDKNGSDKAASNSGSSLRPPAGALSLTMPRGYPPSLAEPPSSDLRYSGSVGDNDSHMKQLEIARMDIEAKLRKFQILAEREAKAEREEAGRRGVGGGINEGKMSRESSVVVDVRKTPKDHADEINLSPAVGSSLHRDEEIAGGGGGGRWKALEATAAQVFEGGGGGGGGGGFTQSNGG